MVPVHVLEFVVLAPLDLAELGKRMNGTQEGPARFPLEVRKQPEQQIGGSVEHQVK